MEAHTNELTSKDVPVTLLMTDSGLGVKKRNIPVKREVFEVLTDHSHLVG